jgi:hypothetical protein
MEPREPAWIGRHDAMAPLAESRADFGLQVKEVPSCFTSVIL